MTSPSLLSRMAAVALTGGLLTFGAPALAADPDLPSGRKLVHHTVRPGETATGLAVRYHAWTAELISLNGLGRHAPLHVGQRLKVPVVLAALPRKRATKRDRHAFSEDSWAPADTSRAKVRRIVVRTANRHGVDPELALAVSWQESGWQMHHVSSANAIGAMQVLPDTGKWMSLYADRRLRLRDVRDNVTAGVLLLDVLRDQTTSDRRMIAAYYQGLGAVRRHGLYAETRGYVKNVMAIKDRLERGLPPS